MASPQPTNIAYTYGQQSGFSTLSLGKNYENSGLNLQTVIADIFTNSSSTLTDYFTSSHTINHSVPASLYQSQSYTGTSSVLDEIDFKINSDLSTGDKFVVIANYQDASANSTYETSVDNVTVSHIGSSQTSISVTSSVDPSSNAYIDSKLKVTFTDPYLSDPSFNGDVISEDGSQLEYDFTGIFNTGSNSYVSTRNDNAQKSLNDSAGITIGPYTSWNCENAADIIHPYGPFFVNADVSLQTSGLDYGKPIYTEFTDPSNNVLNAGYSVDLLTNADPSFGRYALVTEIGNNIVIDVCDNTIDNTFNMSAYSTHLNLVDNTYDYTSDELVNGDLSNLQTAITLNSSPFYIDQYNDTEGGILSGFELRITSTATTSALSLGDNSNITPATINSTGMIFDPYNMNYLNIAYSEGTLSDLTGNNNYFKVQNGTLSLTNANDENGSIDLGTSAEYLTYAEWGNGYIDIASTDVETNGANGDRASMIDNANNGSYIFTNFGVRYYNTETNISGFDVGTMDSSLRTQEFVNFKTTTIFPPTTIDNSGNYSSISNYIYTSNGAVAFVSDPSNASIISSDISFNNTGSFTDELDSDKLYIIDYICQRTWEENNLYNSSNNPVDSIAYYFTGTNAINNDLKDLQLTFTQKYLTDLSSNVSNSWSLAVPDGERLISSNANQGVISDVDINTILSESDSSANIIAIEFKYDISNCAAESYTEFHGEMSFTYGGNTQITYDDELTYTDISSNSSYSVITTPTPPAGCELRQYTVTTLFTVDTIFRFGNYTNIKITSSELTSTLTYYALYKNDVEQPRYRLRYYSDLEATISLTGNETASYTFYPKDLKPYTVTLKQTSSTSPSSFSSVQTFSVDMWYNTQTDISVSGFADMQLDINITSLNYTLNIPTMTGDLSLKEGTDTFTASGTSFDASNIDMTFDLNTVTISNTLELGGLTYDLSGVGTPDVPGQATLSGNGFTFTYNQNMLVSLRIIVLKSGIFEISQYNFDMSVYPGSGPDEIHTVFAENSNYLIRLYPGIYINSDLSVTNQFDSATWQLLNDTVTVNFYTGYTITDTLIDSVSKTISSDQTDSNNKARDVIFNWYRGYVQSRTTITRTATQGDFRMSGYANPSYDMYYNQTVTQFGGLTTTDQISMYDDTLVSSASFDENWSISIDTEGSYNVTVVHQLNDTPVTTTVYSHAFEIYNGKGLNVITNSLNTTDINYHFVYTGALMLVYYNSDYTYSGSIDASTNWTGIGYFEAGNLSDLSSNNIIGNILDIHLPEGTPESLTAYFSICPPFLQFKVIDPSGVTTNPNTNINQSTFYEPVDLDSYSYNPFSSKASINDITFTDNVNSFTGSDKTYFSYLNSNSSQEPMNISTNNILVQLAYGLNDPSYNYQSQNDPSGGGYLTYYNGLVTYVDNSNIQISDIDLTTGTFQISLKQSHLTGTNFVPDNISDLSDNTLFDTFNIIADIGNAFINDSTVINLDYYAGEKISFETWVSNDPEYDGSGNILVKLHKYYNTSDRNLSAQLHSSYNFGYPANLSFNMLDIYTASVPIPTKKTNSVTKVSDFISTYLDLNTTNSLSSHGFSSSTETGTYPILRIDGYTISATTLLIAALSPNSNIPIKMLAGNTPAYMIFVDKLGNKLVTIGHGSLTSKTVTLTPTVDNSGYLDYLSNNPCDSGICGE